MVKLREKFCHEAAAPQSLGAARSSKQLFGELFQLDQIFPQCGIITPVGFPGQRLAGAVVNTGATVSCKVKGSPQPDGAQRIQFVGVIDYLRLQGSGRLAGTAAEAVSADAGSHFIAECLIAYCFTLKNLNGKNRPQRRMVAAAAFRRLHGTRNVMQEGGSGNDGAVASQCPAQIQRLTPDAFGVIPVMAGTVLLQAFPRNGDQASGLPGFKCIRN